LDWYFKRKKVYLSKRMDTRKVPNRRLSDGRHDVFRTHRGINPTIMRKYSLTEAAMNFVVIGADAAGMSAASRAKRTISDLEVTVFEKTRDVSYSA
jgi:hypothetical protein